MIRKKLDLEALSIKSFVTSISANQRGEFRAKAEKDVVGGGCPVTLASCDDKICTGIACNHNQGD